MAHLTPGQFVDIAEGVLAEADAPHMEGCAECQEQLADVRAMMAEAADVEVPEPSPLYWDQLSERVRQVVADEPARTRTWRERLLQPRVWAPVLAGALAVALFVVLQPRESPAPPVPLPRTASTISATPLPITAERAPLPKLDPPLLPLGSSDDPQLGLVADYGVALGWDEMRDEIAVGVPGASSDAVLDSLTVGEQRELQRLLADEMTQPAVPENRS
jgi:hypothetical protein